MAAIGKQWIAPAMAFARLERQDWGTMGDRWHIGTCVKARIATLIARYVERGIAAWDAPLASLLPNLTGDMYPTAAAVTLAQLLTMRAGLPENPVTSPGSANAQQMAEFMAFIERAATDGGWCAWSKWGQECSILPNDKLARL